MISKIISGGQTGADQGGLSAAIILNIKTGGTAPKGYRTQAGSASWLNKLGLLEHSSSDYAPRTQHWQHLYHRGDDNMKKEVVKTAKKMYKDFDLYLLKVRGEL